MQNWVFLLNGITICGGVNVVFEYALYVLGRGNSVTIASRMNLSPEKARWHKGTEKFCYATFGRVSR